MARDVALPPGLAGQQDATGRTWQDAIGWTWQDATGWTAGQWEQKPRQASTDSVAAHQPAAETKTTKAAEEAKVRASREDKAAEAKIALRKTADAEAALRKAAEDEAAKAEAEWMTMPLDDLDHKQIGAIIKNLRDKQNKAKGP